MTAMQSCKLQCTDKAARTLLPTHCAHLMHMCLGKVTAAVLFCACGTVLRQSELRIQISGVYI